MLGKQARPSQTNTAHVLSYAGHGCYNTPQHTSTHTMKMGEGTLERRRTGAGKDRSGERRKRLVKVNVTLEGVILRHVVWTNIK